MNMHVMTEEQKQKQHYASVRNRLNNTAPKAQIRKTEEYYEGALNGLKHVNKVLREELDQMKKSLRWHEAETSRLTFELQKFGKDSAESVMDMRQICERILAEHYPELSFKTLQADNRRREICAARNQCFYEVFVAREDLTLAEKARFFNRDHSTFRRGLKQHAKAHGLQCSIL